MHLKSHWVLKSLGMGVLGSGMGVPAEIRKLVRRSLFPLNWQFHSEELPLPIAPYRYMIEVKLMVDGQSHNLILIPIWMRLFLFFLPSKENSFSFSLI